jgi:hypothetical protein
MEAPTLIWCFEPSGRWRTGFATLLPLCRELHVSFGPGDTREERLGLALGLPPLPVTLNDWLKVQS